MKQKTTKSYVAKFTCSAVGRSLGSNANNLCNSRSANGSTLGNFSLKGIGFFLRISIRYFLAFSLRTLNHQKILFQYNPQKDQIYQQHITNRIILPFTTEMVSGDGDPRRSVINSNWWTTLLPGNSGFPVSTSAKIQPMLQISIAGVYCKKAQRTINKELKYC